MAEEIRDLIEKKNEEGIRAAEEKAQIIEAAAKDRADEILSMAKREAEEIIASAKDRVRRDDEKERMLLAQAGRDMLLSVRKEINAMLDCIVVAEVRDALTPEALSGMISGAVRNYWSAKQGNVTVLLNNWDLEMLDKHFMNKLSEETKKTILLRPSEEISRGFTISFDEGKSCHDFTDRALADYIGTLLKPKLNQILKDAITEM